MMANASHGFPFQTSLRFFVLSSLLIGVLCKKMVETHHTIELSSLLPSASCKPQATKSGTKLSSLKVAHKYGPCTGLNDGQGRQRPPHSEILQGDRSRVDSINSRLAASRKASPVMGGASDPRESKTTVIPAKLAGRTLGSGNYLVTLGMGTPWKQMTVVFDTGSDLTWTQCKPCVRSCYQQGEPMFDSTASTSYINVSCAADACAQLTSATGTQPGCSASTCVYGVEYSDSSYSIGFLAKDRLRVTTSDTFNNIVFGCGQNNQASFGGAAGLLGLGRGKLSFIEQSAAKYGRYFSHCLPTSLSSTGHLTFGKGSRGNNIKFTPLLNVDEEASLYGVTLEGIAVGGKNLSISAATFSSWPTVIDSGTAITRLPPTAYAALKDSFKRGMSQYPSAPALSILDTCYDMTGYSTVSLPRVGFSFKNASYVDLDPLGILYIGNNSRICLAFAPNNDDSDGIIYGNVQQQSFEVVYDIEASRIGFGANGC